MRNTYTPPEHRKGHDALAAKITHRERLLALRDYVGDALLAGFVIDNVDKRTVPVPLFTPSDKERPQAATIGFSLSSPETGPAIVVGHDARLYAVAPDAAGRLVIQAELEPDKMNDEWVTMMADHTDRVLAALDQPLIFPAYLTPPSQS
jgi:hypothetical protein